MRGALTVIAILLLSSVISWIPGALAYSSSEIPQDSYEPDNTFSEAKEIKSGEIQVHTLPKGDVDFVYFVLSSWSFVTVETAPPPGESDGDTIIYLYNSNEQQIAMDDNSGTGLYSKISIFLPKGEYYVKVIARNPIPKYYLYFVAKPEEPPIVFSATDPRGDDYGPGSYVYPLASNFTKGAFDVLSFKVFETNLFIGFSVSFANLGGNPWNLSHGYSLQIIGIYIDAIDGEGSTYIGPGPNVEVPQKYGWDFGILATGAYCRAFLSTGVKLTGAIMEWVSGNSVEIAIEKKAIPSIYLENVSSWKYYVLVGGYSPDDPTGWRKVDVYPGFWVFGGGDPKAIEEGIAPRVIDYIAPPWASQKDLLSSWNLTSRSPPIIYPIWKNSKPPLPHGIKTILRGQNVTISWIPYSWATGYRVKILGMGKVLFDKTLKSPPLTYVLPGGISCEITLETYSKGYYSEPYSIFVNVSMPPVEDLSVKPAMTSATISWKSTTPSSVKEYEWEISKSNDFSKVLIKGFSKKESIEIKGLMANRTYYFRVRQISVEGVNSSWALISFNTSKLVLSSPKIKVIPEYVGAEVFWSKISYADKYEVKVIDQESGEEILDKTAEGTSLYLKDLQEFHEYVVYVRAINLTENVTSKWSSAKFVTKYLIPPKIISAQRAKEGILINWTKEKGEEYYEVQVFSSENSKLVTDVKTPRNSTYLNLTPGKYYVKVRGYNSTYRIYSPWGPVEVLTVPPPSPLEQIISIIKRGAFFIGGGVGALILIFILIKRAKAKKLERAKREALKRAASRK